MIASDLSIVDCSRRRPDKLLKINSIVMIEHRGREIPLPASGDFTFGNFLDSVYGTLMKYSGHYSEKSLGTLLLSYRNATFVCQQG
ncbi:MAG: hypothetical protein U9R56_08370 [candidate division Zixibacteria bacterium]|nr:hypothetical protein [candidate division Zixibacteria bacterium]